MKKLLLSAVAVATSLMMTTGAMAQRSCATMQHLEQQIQQDPSIVSRMEKIERATEQWISQPNAQRTQTVITIPVVVHVVYNTAAQNISDAQVQSQIDVLNEDYRKLNADASLIPSVFAGLAADCQIQFCLAKQTPTGAATNGIVRKSTTVTSWTTNDNVKYSSKGGDDAWDATRYLNLWACNLGSGLLGYAQFPGGAAATDGVVCLYSAFGRVGTLTTTYNKGRTCTHEVGHWLNLRHIWGDASCGNDLVNDTPTQSTSNYGCPAFPHVTCSNGPNGDMFMNYMDYTDDACMYMFTAGQSARMTAAINTSRAGLLTSNGCVDPTGGVCNVPTGFTATSVSNTSETISWTAVSGAASYNVQYRQTGTTTWTAATAASASLTLSGLVAGTAYEYQVQTVCSGTSSSAFSGTNTFTTSNTTATCGTATGLAASAITTTTATLGWTAVSGAGSYNVQYRLSSSATWTTATATTNSLAISGLTAASGYTFQVQTVCLTGALAAYSATATFTTSSASTCSDPYEANETRTTAKTIAVNTDIYAKIGTSTDKDYYKFVTVTGATNIKLTLDQLPADYDLKLLASGGSTLATSANAGTTAESIIRNTTTAATYYAYVYGYASAFNATSCYHLLVSASGTTFRDANSAASPNGSTIAIEKINGIDELTLFPNPASDELKVNFFITNSTGVQAEVVDMLGKTVLHHSFTADEGFNSTLVDITSLNNGIYFMRVQQGEQTVVKKFIVKH